MPVPGDSTAPAAEVLRRAPPFSSFCGYKTRSLWEKFGQKLPVSRFVSAATLLPSLCLQRGSRCQHLYLGPSWKATELGERGVDPQLRVDVWGKEGDPHQPHLTPAHPPSLYRHTF